MAADHSYGQGLHKSHVAPPWYIASYFIMRTQLSFSRQLLNMVVKHGHSVFKAHATQGKLAVRRKRTRWNGMLDAVEGLEVLEARRVGMDGTLAERYASAVASSLATSASRLAVRAASRAVAKAALAASLAATSARSPCWHD